MYIYCVCLCIKPTLLPSPDPSGGAGQVSFNDAYHQPLRHQSLAVLHTVVYQNAEAQGVPPPPPDFGSWTMGFPPTFGTATQSRQAMVGPRVPQHVNFGGRGVPSCGCSIAPSGRNLN